VIVGLRERVKQILVRHARRVYRLVVVSICTLSRFNSWSYCINVLLFIVVGRKWGEYWLVDFAVFLKLLKRFFAFDFEFFYTFVFQAFEDTVSLPVSIIWGAVKHHALAIIVSGLIISDFIGVRIPTNLMVQVRHALPVIVVLISRFLARVLGVLNADLLI
jgi:hypothetical protein